MILTPRTLDRLFSTSPALLALTAFTAATFAAPPLLAQPRDDVLAVGSFDEHGAAVQGHGRVLARALGFELSRSGAFTLVADDRAKRAALDRIKRDLTRIHDDAHWVEVGNAVGATQLLLGEVQEDRNTCLAFAQLIDLETQKTRVTRPEYYDCTRSDLVQVAGDLSMQLAGKRASTPAPRKHLLAHQRTVNIQMRDKTAVVGDKRYTFVEGEIVPDDGRRPPPEPPSAETPPAEAPVEPRPEPPVTHTSPSPPIPAPWAPPFDLTRWPGLDAPRHDGYTLHHLARLVSAKRELFASALLVLPLVLVLLGGVITRVNPSAGHVILRYGFFVSVLALSLELAVVAFYQWILGRSVLLDADPILLAAPPASVALWWIGVRLVRAKDAIGLLRQIPWMIVSAAFFLGLLLVASQAPLPLYVLGGAALVFFGMMRVLAALRKRRAADA